MEQGKAVGIWIRVSTDEQAKGDSPEHHEERARLYAKAKGWDVKVVYHLEAVSGKAVMHHSEAKKMIEDIKKGTITGLIFSKLARLARNTRELLEFAEIFKINNADLISLQESIDTSSASGRLFYTLFAAFAEFEREEIASRVAASVPIRAKLGKSLGGAAPFGYRWHGKELILDQHEAPIRKLMYELYQEHKRKKTVCKILNDKGFRTRNGAKFTDTTLDRLLRDPMAKGERRANYTQSLGEGKHWTIKPETDWVMIACPAIISEDIWEKCLAINNELTTKRAPRPKKAVQLFSGFMECVCGGKMYVPSRTQKYVCSVCKKTSVAVSDIEEIYYENLKQFLLTKNDLAVFTENAAETIAQKESQLETLRKDRMRIQDEMKSLLQLHHKGQIPTNGFKAFYDPLDAQLKQIDTTIVETESQLDILKVSKLDGEQILDNAETLYERWATFDLTVKRRIVEDLTKSILVGREDITITFGYEPKHSLFQNTPKGQRNVRGSLKLSA